MTLGIGRNSCPRVEGLGFRVQEDGRFLKMLEKGEGVISLMM